tara:strand:- start:4955 stop:6730 length:1776 start_codon:yes stop_codon:yes gene_type:complete
MAINFPDSPSNGDTFTASGTVYVYSTANSYWSKQSSTIPLEVTGHVLPDTNITYDLGSTSKRFRDLYIDGNTLDLGGQEIKATASGIELSELTIGSGTNKVKLVATTTGKLETTGTDSGGTTAAATSSLNENSGIEDLSNVTIEVVAETLTIGVDDPTAGHGTTWKWTWPSGPIAYARSSITNSAESSVPLYKGGTYTIFNFAAHEIHGAMTQTHKIHLKWIEGQGIQNNVSWSTETLNVQNITVAGVNGGAATEVQRLVVNVPTTITLPSLVAPTVAYDVAFANAGAYTFSGTRSGDNPSIGPLYKGGTYTFNLDSTLSGHPFYLTTDDGTGFVAGTYVGEYTSGVTGSRNESGTLVFTVPSDAPSTLYYQCGNHAAMKGTITIKDLAVATNGAGNYLIYAQHTQEGHATEIEIRPKPSIPDQVCLVYDSTTNQFVPQDLGEYIETTTVFKEKVKDAAGEKITEKLGDSTLTDLATVKSNTTYIANLSQQGDLAVHTGTARWYAPFGLTMVDVVPFLGTAADADVSVTVKKGSTTVSTFSITAGQLTTDVTGSNSTWTMTSGEYLTVDVTAVGTTSKGKDLVVQFQYRQT